MNRLIVSHFAVAAFVAASVASWKGLVTFYAADPAAVVCTVCVYGGLTLYLAVSQATAAIREIRISALYPSGGVRNIAHRFDLAEE